MQSVKSVELLKSVLPKLSRLAILRDQSFPPHYDPEPTVHTAQAMGIQILDLDVRRVEDVDSAFQAATGWGAEAAQLLVQTNLSAGVDAPRC